MTWIQRLARLGRESFSRLNALPLMERTPVRRYATAGACFLLASVLLQAFDPVFGRRVSFLFYFPAIVVSAWYGGFGPGVFCTALGAAAAASQLGPLAASEIELLVIFTSSGVLITVLSAAQRAAVFRTMDILESIHDAFFMLDREGRFRYVNREAETIWGRRRENLLGLNYKEAFPEAAGSEAVLAVARALADQIPVCIETVGPISKLWVEIRIRPSEGGVSAYFHDISAHKRLEKDLERRIKQGTERLKEVNDELGIFTYSASHDLRGPVRKIMTYCDLLTERATPPLPEEQRSWFRRIRASAVYIDRIIDEMQNLADATQRDLKRETVDMSELAREHFEDIRKKAPERRFDFAVVPGLTARADKLLLRVALHNIIDNAWKFTAAKEEARIEFGSTSTAGGPAFFVKDNGVGFDMKHSSKLFKAFERLHPAEAFPGMGVGLAIAHRVILRHGGAIWAESRPGEGATFYFTLPPEAA